MLYIGTGLCAEDDGLDAPYLGVASHCRCMTSPAPASEKNAIQEEYENIIFRR